MKYIITIFLTQLVFLCYSQNTITGTDKREKLFETDHKWGGRYILLVGDTAYYEAKRADKIPYFTNQDTLIRSGNSNLFYGRNGKMLLADSMIKATMKSGKKNQETNFIFLPASSTQIVQWNIDKNRIKSSDMNAIVNKVLLKKPFDDNTLKNMKTEWQAIGKYIQTLNRDEFDSVLTAFKDKYSIK